MPNRSGKFYRKNEAEIMKSLGLEPTPNSGSGWVIKEDGQNEYLICQLKSTDAQSIRIQQKDITILEENAITVHKVPLFAIQFLNNNDVFIMCRPDDVTEVAKYIKTGKCDVQDFTAGLCVNDSKETAVVVSKQIKSSKSARDEFHTERENKYKKEKSAI